MEALRPAAVAPISLSSGVGFPSASLLPLSKSPTPADGGAKDSKNVEIAEVIVGAILGELISKDIGVESFYFMENYWS